MQKLNKIRQLLALVIVAASMYLVTTIALKVARVKEPAEMLPRLAKNIDVSLQKIHFTEMKKQVKQWDLVADRAEYDKEKDLTRLGGIRLVVAGNRSTGDITLTADRGEYLTKTKDVRLSGNVVATSASGMEFTTSQAAYRGARAMIETPARVRFTNGKLTVEGVGMELFTETKRVRILHDVTATVHPGTRK